MYFLFQSFTMPARGRSPQLQVRTSVTWRVTIFKTRRACARALTGRSVLRVSFLFVPLAFFERHCSNLHSYFRKFRI